MPNDIEDADAGILKALSGLGCLALIVLAVVVGIIATLIHVWRH